MRKLSLFLACLILSVFFSSCGGDSAEPDARIMEVFRVDGGAVRLTRGAQGATDAIAGMGIHEGYVVSTGLDSFCFIRLDADSLVKMDVSTDISVDRVTDSLLRISLDSGQVLVDIREQTPEHTLETRIGSTVISVSGTMFIAGVYPGGEAIIIVLDGAVYANDMPLEAGYTMWVYDGVTMDVDISPTVFAYLDGFQLQAFADNWEWLIDAGVMGGADLDEVRRLLDGIDEAVEEPQEAEPTPTPTPTPEPDLVAVPDVYGMTYSYAESLIRAAGLTPYVCAQERSALRELVAIGYDPPIVRVISPAAGTLVSRNSVVQLFPEFLVD